MAVKRALDPATSADGIRVLVERRWPPGKRKEQVAVDLWLHDAAPSDTLRRWYGRDASRWEDFIWRYRTEISQQRDLVRLLHELERRGPVTLLHAGGDGERNNAAALRRILDELA